MKTNVDSLPKKYPRAYRIWAQMKGRCTNPSNPSFKNYGERGISVCDRWTSFSNFIEDMGSPEDGLTLDRINNDGNYEPSNCRWASRTTQCRNRRSNQIVTVNGLSMCISEWAEQVGIKQETLSRRLRAGWSPEKAVSLPAEKAHHKKLIEFNGEKLGLAQWAGRIGISKITLKTRLNRGWTLERALNHAGN